MTQDENELKWNRNKAKQDENENKMNYQVYGMHSTLNLQIIKQLENVHTTQAVLASGQMYTGWGAQHLAPLNSPEGVA